MKKLGWILIICLFFVTPMQALAQTNLLTPSNGQVIFTQGQYASSIDFSWSDYDPYVRRYELEVGTSPELDEWGFGSLKYSLPALKGMDEILNAYPAVHYKYWALPLGTYYWHVRTWYNYGTPGVWSPIYSFTIQNPPPLPSAPVKVKAQSIISLKTIPKKIKKGKTAILKGRLFKRGSQANIAGVPVIIQRRSLGYWTATRVLKTKTDGSFAVRLKPSKTAVFRAHFQENNNYLSSSSNSVKIAVIQPKKKPKKKR